MHIMLHKQNKVRSLLVMWRERKWKSKKWDKPMSMRRLSGLSEHFIRRRSSLMRSSDGTSSKFAAAAALPAILV
jgi:hypothetical protein